MSWIHFLWGRKPPFFKVTTRLLCEAHHDLNVVYLSLDQKPKINIWNAFDLRACQDRVCGQEIKALIRSHARDKKQNHASPSISQLSLWTFGHWDTVPSPKTGRLSRQSSADDKPSLLDGYFVTFAAGSRRESIGEASRMAPFVTTPSRTEFHCKNRHIGQCKVKSIQVSNLTKDCTWTWKAGHGSCFGLSISKFGFVQRFCFQLWRVCFGSLVKPLICKNGAKGWWEKDS